MVNASIISLINPLTIRKKLEINIKKELVDNTVVKRIIGTLIRKSVLFNAQCAQKVLTSNFYEQRVKKNFN